MVKLFRGELVGCFGLTEPNHGSDPAHMETKVCLYNLYISTPPPPPPLPILVMKRVVQFVQPFREQLYNFERSCDKFKKKFVFRLCFQLPDVPY
jgi:hypothetical protein